MCSDGAAVNRAGYNQLVDELGPQYLSMFCLSHKFELALNAFQISKQNENSKNSYTDFYFLNAPHFVGNFSRDKVFSWSFQEENTNCFLAQGGLNIEQKLYSYQVL